MDPNDIKTSPLGDTPVGTVSDDVETPVSTPVEPVVPQAPEEPVSSVVSPVDQSGIGVSEEPIASEPPAVEPTVEPLAGVANEPSTIPTVEPEPVIPVVKPMTTPSVSPVEEPPVVAPTAQKPVGTVGVAAGPTKLRP